MQRWLRKTTFDGYSAAPHNWWFDKIFVYIFLYNEIWQMLLVTHYSFATRLAVQGAQCSVWKWRFKKSVDESSTTCSDGFKRLHSMDKARPHTIGYLTRSLYIFFYVPREHSHMTADIFWVILTYLPTYPNQTLYYISLKFHAYFSI